MAPSTDSSKLSEEIDQLLEHYLELLDQYTALRSQLSSVQSSVSQSTSSFGTSHIEYSGKVHQHIARANFLAERGIRYGPDFYDARMQATRVCTVTVPRPDGDTSTTAGTQQERRAEGEPTLDDVERNTAATPTAELKEGTTSTAAGQYSEEEKGKTAGTAYFAISAVNKKVQEKDKVGGASGAGTKDPETTKPVPKDPLRMFGLLTPPSLRLAQNDSVKSIENIIPKLVSVDAEMKEVEIRIRRARKWKVKAETQEGKATENANEKGFARTAGRQEVAV